MMTFDVFITGIQASRLDESEKIKLDLAKFLKKDLQEIELLLSKSSNKRVFQNISGQEAEKHQQDLFALGITSTYRPGSGDSELSLVAKEEEKDEANICPNCNHETPRVEGENSPDMCPECGVSRTRFLEMAKLKAEKEEVRKRLLRSENSKNAIEKIKQEALAEEKRQKQLEDEIREELDIKKDKKPLIYAGGALLIGAIAFSIYPYFSQSDILPSTDFTFNEADSLNTAQGSQQPPGQNSQQDFNSSGATPGQQSLQQTYERSSEVLDAFGLDTGALTGTNEAALPMPGSDTAALLTTTGGNQAPGIATAFLLDKEAINQLWDHFLVNQIQAKIAQRKEQTAFHLSQYITDTKSFIEVQGRLLAITRQTKNKNKLYGDIEAKISLLPPGKQVQFLAQAGLQQYKVDNTRSLLDQANELWKTLAAPEEQLDAILHLGVAYYKLGSVNIANQYFGKINDLVSKISTNDNKIHARIAVAKAYKDAGSVAIGSQWLASTKKLVPSASNRAYAEIVTGYAYLDQLEGTIKSIQLRPLHLSQDELLYKAIQAFISIGSYNNANSLLSRIQEANFKAASYLLMAGSVQKNSRYINFAEKLINQGITNSLDKAILSSQAAFQYSMQHNNQKTKAIYQLTKTFLNSVSSSAQKDKALDIISVNYARTLNPAYLPALLDFIQSPNLRSSLEVERIKTQKIKALIN